MNCPRLTAGLDFAPTDTHPVVILRPIEARLSYDLGAVYQFFSGEKLLARHDAGVLTIMPGYACDGYSPVLRKPRWMPGKDRYIRLTPTPRCGIFPAVLHDFTRQFSPVDGCPWNRERTDDWLYLSLVAGGCSEDAGIYHAAVAGYVGTTFIRLTTKPDPALVILRTRYP